MEDAALGLADMAAARWRQSRCATFCKPRRCLDDSVGELNRRSRMTMSGNGPVNFELAVLITTATLVGTRHEGLAYILV